MSAIELSLSGAQFLNMYTFSNADERCVLTVKDANGALLDMSAGFICYMHIKKDKKDALPFIQLLDTTHIIRGNGTLEIKIFKSQKTGKSGKYEYDLILYKPIGDLTTLLSYGNFTILEGVTKIG